MGGGGGGGTRSVAGQNTLFVLLLCEHKLSYLLMSQNSYIFLCLRILISFYVSKSTNKGVN